MMSMKLDPTDVHQLRTWAESLARTQEAQIHIIRDMLCHASEDNMTTTDRTFACATLHLLESIRTVRPWTPEPGDQFVKVTEE